MGSPTPASYPHASLLLRRMKLLNIQPNELRSADPLLFRELQGRCSLCGDTEICVSELAHSASQNWREYCPNQRILTILSVLGTGWLDAQGQSVSYL